MVKVPFGLNTARVPGEPVPSDSALVADVVYLRPADRAPLLGILANCGILVRESSALVPGSYVSAGRRGDMAVAVTDASASSLAIVRAISNAYTVTLALSESESVVADLAAAGATHVAHESSGWKTLALTLREAARLARLTREGEGPASSPLFGTLELRLSPPELCATVGSIRLSAVEFRVLHLLARRRGELVARSELLAAISSGEPGPNNGYLKTVVLRLRRKAELLAGNPQLLGSLRGAGYILKG